MGQIADWLGKYEQAQAVYGQIMDRLQQPAQPQDNPSSLLNPDETDLLTLLEQWRQITAAMDTPSLGPEAKEIRDQIADLLRMNNEIAAGASEVRDLIAGELSRRKKAGKSVKAYKSVSGQR